MLDPSEWTDLHTYLDHYVGYTIVPVTQWTTDGRLRSPGCCNVLQCFSQRSLIMSPRWYVSNVFVNYIGTWNPQAVNPKSLSFFFLHCSPLPVRQPVLQKYSSRTIGGKHSIFESVSVTRASGDLCCRSTPAWWSSSSAIWWKISACLQGHLK